MTKTDSMLLIAQRYIDKSEDRFRPNPGEKPDRNGNYWRTTDTGLKYPIRSGVPMSQAVQAALDYRAGKKTEPAKWLDERFPSVTRKIEITNRFFGMSEAMGQWREKGGMSEAYHTIRKLKDRNLEVLWEVGDIDRGNITPNYEILRTFMSAKKESYLASIPGGVTRLMGKYLGKEANACREFLAERNSILRKNVLEIIDTLPELLTQYSKNDLGEMTNGYDDKVHLKIAAIMKNFEKIRNGEEPNPIFAPKPKRPVGRPRKNKPEMPKRKRGRPRKNKEQPKPDMPKRKRGRPRKIVEPPKPPEEPPKEEPPEDEPQGPTRREVSRMTAEEKEKLKGPKNLLGFYTYGDRFKFRTKIHPQQLEHLVEEWNNLPYEIIDRLHLEEIEFTKTKHYGGGMYYPMEAKVSCQVGGTGKYGYYTKSNENQGKEWDRHKLRHELGHALFYSGTLEERNKWQNTINAMKVNISDYARKWRKREHTRYEKQFKLSEVRTKAMIRVKRANIKEIYRQFSTLYPDQAFKRQRLENSFKYEMKELHYYENGLNKFGRTHANETFAESTAMAFSSDRKSNMEMSLHGDYSKRTINQEAWKKVKPLYEKYLSTIMDTRDLILKCLRIAESWLSKEKRFKPYPGEKPDELGNYWRTTSTGIHYPIQEGDDVGQTALNSILKQPPAKKKPTKDMNYEMKTHGKIEIEVNDKIAENGSWMEHIQKTWNSIPDEVMQAADIVKFRVNYTDWDSKGSYKPLRGVIDVYVNPDGFGHTIERVIRHEIGHALYYGAKQGARLEWAKYVENKDVKLSDYSFKYDRQKLPWHDPLERKSMVGSLRKRLADCEATKDCDELEREIKFYSSVGDMWVKSYADEMFAEATAITLHNTTPIDEDSDLEYGNWKEVKAEYQKFMDKLLGKKKIIFKSEMLEKAYGYLEA